MSTSTLPRWAAAALALVAGLLMVIPVPWAAWWPLVPLGYGLYFALVESAPTHGQAALRGYLTGLGITIIGFYWLTYPMIQYGGVPWPFSVLILLLYSVVFGLKLPVCAVVLRLVRQRVPLSPLWTWPVVAVAMELPPLSLFPFDIGNLITGNVLLLQAADIVGTAGIAYPVALVAVWLYRTPRRRLETIYVLMVLALWFGYGGLRLHQVADLESRAPTVRVALIQPDTRLKFSSESQAYPVVRTLLQLTEQAAQQGPLDLVVWPEGGAPLSFDTRHLGIDMYFNKVITDLARRLHTEILFNDNAFDGDRQYNSATLVDRQGQKVGRYDKVLLLAFGEYMPFANVFPVLRQFGIYDLTAGQDVHVLPLDNGVQIAPEICYEILFPNFTRRFVNQGASLIVNLTDDAWFGPTLGSVNHLRDLMPRSIENRVPVLRCTNTGITTVISPTGRYQTPFSPLFEPTFQVVDVHPLKLSTFYSRQGDVFAWTCVLLLALWCAFPPTGVKPGNTKMAPP